MSSQLEHEAEWESSVLAWLHRQLLLKQKTTATEIDLTGRSAIVTGANVGLGFECCRQLLKLGLSHLILAVRSESKGKTAAARMSREFKEASIDVFTVDMESYNSVVEFAQRCTRVHKRPDIAILNAGLMGGEFQRSPETQHEITLQVNYLSTALLAIQLLPICKARRPEDTAGRITIIGSDMSYWAHFPVSHTESSILSYLDKEDSYGSAQRYALTKLMIQMFVVKLAEQVSAEDVIINVASPGFCAGTSLNRQQSRSWLAKAISSIFAKTTEDGVLAYIDAAVVKGKESHGSYNSDGLIKAYPKFLYSKTGKQAVAKLWTETLKELEFARVEELIY